MVVKKTCISNGTIYLNLFISLIAPGDYITTSAKVSFNSTFTASCVRIPLADDSVHDNINGGMLFSAFLESNDRAVTFRQGRDRASVIILEDDGKRNIMLC